VLGRRRGGGGGGGGERGRKQPHPNQPPAIQQLTKLFTSPRKVTKTDVDHNHKPLGRRGIKYVSKPVFDPVPAGPYSTVGLPCPSGEEVVGGATNNPLDTPSVHP
jgi:hypothetical protein